MRGICLLLLMILIESCVAHPSALHTKRKCKKLGKQIGAEVFCQPRDEVCDGTLYTGKAYCKNPENYGCCVPECGDPQPACEQKRGECQPKTEDCPGKMLIGNKYCKSPNKCGCCAPIDCSKETLTPCEALNGICISQDQECDGREVIHETFCKFADTCKCCFPNPFSTTCPDCKAPPNGNVTMYYGISGPIICKYECHHGFRLEGSEYSHCLDNGTWSPPTPKCIHPPSSTTMPAVITETTTDTPTDKCCTLDPPGFWIPAGFPGSKPCSYYGAHRVNDSGIWRAGAICCQVDICTLQKDHGGGLAVALSLRYYFNMDVSNCQSFIYRGEGGNANRFLTYDACVMKCGPVEDETTIVPLTCPHTTCEPCPTCSAVTTCPSCPTPYPGGYFGPYDDIWSDDQCSSTNLHGLSLSECMDECDRSSSCTAINFSESGPYCNHRACSLPIPQPQWNYPPYKGYSKFRIMGGYFGPYNNIWSDDQCSPTNLPRISLSECMDECDRSSSCTAINYNESPPNCVHRACSLPIPQPQWNYPPHKGYSKFKIIVHPTCPEVICRACPTSSPTPTPVTCDTPGAQNIGQPKQCLYYSTEADGWKSWPDAVAACASMGGALAGKLEDPRAVVEYALRNGGWQGWVGGSDAAKEGTWVWLDGQDVGYGTLPWRTRYNEPNGGKSENCLYGAYNGFYDRDCSKPAKYICDMGGVSK